MKKKSLFAFRLAFGMLVCLGLLNFQTRACNNSSFTLVSVATAPGPVYTITTQLCLGYGRTGTLFGADQGTGTFFAFLIYGSPTIGTNYAGASNYAGPPLPGVTYFPGQIGPMMGMGESDIIAYWDACPEPGCANITCISSTAACGNAGSWCQTIVFTYNGALPDSIRAVGIEGLAPAGCGTQDMVVSLTGPLPVTFNQAQAITNKNQIALDWQISSDLPVKNFQVLRSQNLGTFTPVAEISALAGHDAYQWLDQQPAEGTNYYRIVATDESGTSYRSPLLTAHFSSGPQEGELLAFPNPFQDKITLSFTQRSTGLADLQLLDVAGKVVHAATLPLSDGLNEVSLDLSALPPGIYTARITGKDLEVKCRVSRI